MKRKLELFRSEDFNDINSNASVDIGTQAAALANLALQQHLGLEIFTDDGAVWSKYADGRPTQHDTYRAFLICVEEIKKECVKHEPARRMDEYGYHCLNCGAELVAEWKVIGEL